MKTLKLFFVIAAAALLSIACGENQSANQPVADAGRGPAATATEQATPAATPTPDELAQARSDYNNFCVRCHKEDGTGGKFELEEGGTINVLSLRKHGLKDSDQELAHHIADGGKQMPAFKDRLSEERINGLVKFIRAEYHGRAPNGPAAATGAAAAASPAR
jgi:mono/diheme cytochrome c family protein